jgi:hypothetical protein
MGPVCKEMKWHHIEKALEAIGAETKRFWSILQHNRVST